MLVVISIPWWCKSVSVLVVCWLIRWERAVTERGNRSSGMLAISLSRGCLVSVRMTDECSVAGEVPERRRWRWEGSTSLRGRCCFARAFVLARGASCRVRCVIIGLSCFCWESLTFGLTKPLPCQSDKHKLIDRRDGKDFLWETEEFWHVNVMCVTVSLDVSCCDCQWDCIQYLHPHTLTHYHVVNMFSSSVCGVSVCSPDNGFPVARWASHCCSRGVMSQMALDVSLSVGSAGAQVALHCVVGLWLYCVHWDRLFVTILALGFVHEARVPKLPQENCVFYDAKLKSLHCGVEQARGFQGPLFLKLVNGSFSLIKAESITRWLEPTRRLICWVVAWSPWLCWWLLCARIHTCCSSIGPHVIRIKMRNMSWNGIIRLWTASCFKEAALMIEEFCVCIVDYWMVSEYVAHLCVGILIATLCRCLKEADSRKKNYWPSTEASCVPDLGVVREEHGLDAVEHEGMHL